MAGVSLTETPPPPLNRPPGQRAPLDRDPPPPMNRITDRCKDIPCRNFVTSGNKCHGFVCTPSRVNRKLFLILYMCSFTSLNTTYGRTFNYWYDAHECKDVRPKRETFSTGPRNIVSKTGT